MPRGVGIAALSEQGGMLAELTAQGGPQALPVHAGDVNLDPPAGGQNEGAKDVGVLPQAPQQPPRSVGVEGGTLAHGERGRVVAERDAQEMPVHRIPM